MLPEGFSSDRGPRNTYTFNPIEDMLKDKYVSMLMEIHTSKNFGMNAQPNDNYNGCGFSITGGYCRNHMLSIQAVTDVDIVTNSIDTTAQLFSEFYPDISENRTIRTFRIPDNTMHILPYPYYYVVNNRTHIMIDPARFDFTINLGCISMVDGKLYVPPVTLFDIKNKIIRPCMTSFGANYSPSSIMLLSVILRAIRFSLKFDMVVRIW